MHLLSLFGAGASLISFAAATPEAYPDLVNFAGRFDKRSLTNNLGQRDELCNGTIVLDTKTEPYQIAPGDTLTKIADNFHRGICDIASYNNITDVDFILAGANITIPAQVCNPDSSTCLTKTTPTATCINGGPGFYIIREGDALGLVARSFNVTLETITSANKQNIPNPDVIYPGQIVNIPICEYSKCDISAYKIMAGDTFFKLGRRYHSSAGQNLALNPGVDPNNLQIGQIVTIASFCYKLPGFEPPNEL